MNTFCRIHTHQKSQERCWSDRNIIYVKTSPVLSHLLAMAIICLTRLLAMANICLAHLLAMTIICLAHLLAMAIICLAHLMANANLAGANLQLTNFLDKHLQLGTNCKYSLCRYNTFLSLGLRLQAKNKTGKQLLELELYARNITNFSFCSFENNYEIRYAKL